MPFIITGATVEVSVRTFYDWIFAQLCNNTSLHIEENGVRLKIANNRVMYANNAFQKLWHPRRKQWMDSPQIKHMSGMCNMEFVGDGTWIEA